MIIPISYFNPNNGQNTTLIERVQELYATGATSVTITELEKTYENNAESILQMMEDVTAYLNLIYKVDCQVVPNQAPPASPQVANGSVKSKKVALLFCIFLGGFGVHRFYVGRVGTGVASVATLGGLGVWTLVDFILILCNKFKDVDEQPLCNW